MKIAKKLILMLGLLLGLFACSSLPTEEDSSSSVKSSVKFTMENIGATNSNILFSSTDGETPSKVALTYKKSGENEETSTIIELTAFGNSYITDDVLSLYEGTYVLTKFDVLNDTGETIYSTPVSGSDIASNLNITTALAYSFEVKEGEISTEKMQVVAVTDTTDPADFGHAAFTLDLVDYNRFYIEVLVLDETEGWVYTTAQIEVKNAEGTTIKTASLDGKMNKVIVANSESYTITISKDGYTSQEFSSNKDDLAKYENEAMVVKLKKNTNISTEGLIAYYPFNGNANDESGTGNDGTVYGSTLTTDRFGNENSAYSFDGTDDYISLPNTNSLKFGSNSYSTSFWVKSGSSVSSSYPKTLFGSNWQWCYGVQTRIETADTITLICTGNDKNNTLKTNLNIEDGVWHNITSVVDVDNCKMYIYVDEICVITKDYTIFNIDNSKSYLIGACSYVLGYPIFYYDGKIDDFRIYNRALSQEEVTALYNETK